MSDTIYMGNFEFVNQIDPQVCKNIRNAERESRLDYETCGSSLRKALEAYCSYLIEKNNNDPNKAYIVLDKDKHKLSDKIKALEENRVLVKDFKDPRFFARTYTIVEDGNQKECKNKLIWYRFVQRLGNKASHNDSAEFKRCPTYSFDNIIKAFEMFYNVLRQEYKRKTGFLKYNNEKINDWFREDIMPIGEHYVIESGVPVGAGIDFLEKEYLTCRLDKGKVDYYSLLRVYNWKNKSKRNEITREKDALSEVIRNTLDEIDGRVRLEIISSMENDNSNFYIIGYEFYGGKPERLSDELLNRMTLYDKQNICKQIASIIYKFHHLSSPVYVRSLSYDNVYIQKNLVSQEGRHKYTVSIIKMENAKLQDERTVKEKDEDYKDKVKDDRSISKYFNDPCTKKEDWKRWENNPNRWEFKDIYAVGILFSDILIGTTMLPRAASGHDVLAKVSKDLKEFAECIDAMKDSDFDGRRVALELAREIEEVE